MTKQSMLATHQRLARLAARWFGGEDSEETVRTQLDLPMQAEALWQSLLTYEEIREPPPWWLRLLLPRPVGTHGDKTRVGTTLPCRYENGDLQKRILVVQPPRKLEFEVIAQRLGIEDCVEARRGSYEIRARGDNESQIELTTFYATRLHPRWLWRPLERWLAHRFHYYILSAMRASFARPERARKAA